MVGGLPPRPASLLRGLPVPVYNVFREGSIERRFCGLCGSASHSLRACPGSSFTNRVLAAQWHLRRWLAVIAFELSAYANMPITAYVRSRAGLAPSIPFGDVVAHARAVASPSDPCPFNEVPLSPPQSNPRAPHQSTIPKGQGQHTTTTASPVQPRPDAGSSRAPASSPKPVPKISQPAPVTSPAPAAPKPALPKQTALKPAAPTPAARVAPLAVAKPRASSSPQDGSPAFRRAPKRGPAASQRARIPSTPKHGAFHPRDWATPSPPSAKDPRPVTESRLSRSSPPNAPLLPPPLPKDHVRVSKALQSFE